MQFKAYRSSYNRLMVVLHIHRMINTLSTASALIDNSMTYSNWNDEGILYLTKLATRHKITPFNFGVNSNKNIFQE